MLETKTVSSYETDDSTSTFQNGNSCSRHSLPVFVVWYVVYVMCMLCKNVESAGSDNGQRIWSSDEGKKEIEID